MEPRISVVTLGVADVVRARRFYETGLGWKAADASNDDVVFIDLNGLVLSLYGRAALAADAKVDAEGSGFSGIAIAHNVRSKQEVDAVLVQARMAGGTIAKVAANVFWGGYSGYFKDPDGHLWEVAHNPFWSFTADGRIVLGK